MITTVARPDGGRTHIITVPCEVDLDEKVKQLDRRLPDGVNLRDRDATQVRFELPGLNGDQRAKIRAALDQECNQPISDGQSTPVGRGNPAEGIERAAKAVAKERVRALMQEFGLALSKDGTQLELRGECRIYFAKQFGQLPQEVAGNVVRIELKALSSEQKQSLLKAAVSDIVKHAKQRRALKAGDKTALETPRLENLRGVAGKILSENEDKAFLALVLPAAGKAAAEDLVTESAARLAASPTVKFPSSEPQHMQARKAAAEQKIGSKPEREGFFDRIRKREKVAAAILIVSSFFLGRSSKRGESSDQLPSDGGHQQVAASVVRFGAGAVEGRAGIFGSWAASTPTQTHDHDHQHEHGQEHEHDDHDHRPTGSNARGQANNGNRLGAGSGGINTGISTSSGSQIAQWSSLSPSQQARLQQARSQGAMNAQFHQDGSFSVQHHKRHQ